MAHTAPIGAAAVQRKGPAHRAAVVGGIEVIKNETGGAAVIQRLQIGVDHGVGQAPDAAHQRQAAVFQAVELGQAAGLEARGNQGDVAAAKDAVRQRLVVIQPHRHAPRVRLRLRCQRMFQGGVAAAQNQQLSATTHHFLDAAEHQRQAFLFGEPAHQRKQRSIGQQIQTGLGLQGRFVQRLAGQFAPIKRVGEQGIVARVPDAAVHAIQDAAELRGAAAQQPVQTESLFRCLDFAGVAGADGADVVGIDQSGFHERYLAVKLQAVDTKGAGRQTQIGKTSGGKAALVGQVVDGEQGRNPLRAVPVGHAGRSKPGVPVMAMHQLGAPARVQAVGQVRRAPGQCGEAAVVVRIGVVLRIVVRVAGPVIQAGRHQHIGLQRATGGTQAGQFTEHDVHALAPGRREAADFFRRAKPRDDGRESGQQGPHRATLRAQRRRQCARHIGKTTGFEQGEQFGADLENAHVRDPGRGD